MKHSICTKGMTLVEIITVMAVFSFAMAALIGASIALQTSFAATEDYFSGQGDQLRVLDYFGTDLRRALAVGLNSNTVTYNGTSYSNTVPSGATKYLTVVIPNYRDATKANRFPTIAADVVTYGTAPVPVSYYLLGSSLYRIEVDPDLAASDARNSAKSIADNVSDFNITDTNISNPLFTETVVSISATFAPKYSRSLWTQSLTSNTTNSRVGTTVGCKIQIRGMF
jgi:prepilin-type N-terminal cleavage/methylation domain-containing protein